MAWVLRTAASAFATIAVVVIVAMIAGRVTRRRPALHAWIARERWPLAASAVTIALRANSGNAPIHGTTRHVLNHGLELGVITLVAWAGLRALLVLEQALSGRFDTGVRDNRVARSRRTQVDLLRRVASAIVVVIATIVALQSFSWGRNLATSLLATGGIVGLVFGISGRSTLGNMIAGIQIAITEPIRLDDVVVVEGEWGNIEEITLTYVIVRLWDQRRLVLPTSFFVDESFQNWTRRTAELLGTVELWVDYTTDIDSLRSCLEDLARSSDRWDGRVAILQVTGATPQALLARALVSATDAPTLWDLRCEIREGLAAFLARPDEPSIPRLRFDAGDGAARVRASG